MNSWEHINWNQDFNEVRWVDGNMLIGTGVPFWQTKTENLSTVRWNGVNTEHVNWNRCDGGDTSGPLRCPKGLFTPPEGRPKGPVSLSEGFSQGTVSLAPTWPPESGHQPLRLLSVNTSAPAFPLGRQIFPLNVIKYISLRSWAELSVSSDAVNRCQGNASSYRSIWHKPSCSFC